MAGWAAEWSGAKDVFKDATKMDKPENVKKVLGIITVNSSNINAALKKVDAEFKKHDDFLKLIDKASWQKLDKIKEAETKIVASTQTAINGYETAAQAYTPKLQTVIDGYKAEKKVVKDKQAQDARNGNVVSPTDIAQLKTSYVRGIQLLDKQLKSISAGIAAELDVFQKKSKAAQAKVSGMGQQNANAALAATALPTARAAIKKAAAFIAQAKAVVGGAYDGKAEREPARIKAFQTLLNKALPEAGAAMKKARDAGLKVENGVDDLFDPRSKRWMNFINDGAQLDHIISDYAKSLKALDAELEKRNR